MNGTKMWSFIGLFMIALVISLPLNSANALALSVQITKNEGQAGIKNYIDATGDVWTVEALIAGTSNDSVSPENVKLKIGENEASFQSCTSSTLGTSCEYISPLTDGVQEGEHAFQVVYNFLNILGNPDSMSNGDFIRADGSAPTIQFFAGDVKQNSKGQVELNFKVTDKSLGAPAVGLKQIDILEANTGEVLESITDFKEGQDSYSYVEDGTFNGLLQAELTGEGKKGLKIRAEDRLGHKVISKAVYFDADFVKPEIVGTFNLTKFGEFIGQFTGSTDVILDVLESSVPVVKAYSDQAKLSGQSAECDSDEEVDNLWHCTWKDVEVNPESTVAILFVIVDEHGNKVEQSLSRTFVVDNSFPQIKFFGTDRQFDGNSYLNGKKENRIILVASDDGAGISADGIRANLIAFGKSSSERPNECEEAEGDLSCYWDVDASLGDGVLTFGLSMFKDNVGNEGDMPESEFFVDSVGPKVEKIEVYGLSEAGDKNYFQSNDIMKIVFTASESSGLNILVDLRDVVMDAETKFPEDFFTQGLGDGWQRFTDDNCEKVKGKWECVLETEALKSGPAKEQIEIKIQDTAGNDANLWPVPEKEPQNVVRGKEGKYTIDIAGLSTEDNPDYWEVSSTRSLLSFVDLDTTQISYTRMPVKVSFKSDSSQAKILSIELIGCGPEEGVLQSKTSEGNETAYEDTAATANNPQISRALLYGTDFPGGSSSPVDTTAILEFQPFNGRQMFGVGSETFDQAEVKYLCQMKIYTKVGKYAIQAAEIQDVKITVPFAFSYLGSMDETLKKKVTDLKEDGWMTFFDVIHVMHLVLQWINYIASILKIIVTVNQIVDLFTESEKGAADALENYPITLAAGTALRGGCLAAQQGTKEGWDFVKYIEVPVRILNCEPDPDTLGPYGWLQKSALDAYNLASGRGVLGIPASSLYENIYTSMLGLCVPGILYNIEKAREVHCRRIVCYGREVPQGIATMESCDQLFDQQLCEMFFGPFLDFMPIGGIAQIGSMIKGMFTSPLGLISLTELIACGILCFTPKSPGILTTCKVTTGLNKVLSIIDSIVSAVKVRPDITESYYCNMADDIKVEELTGQ
ncbi:MAG: hypothetical protein KJ984_04070, partial [Nanoarchaeota archaeon]|nr:hypothetical protein [Nanoarchaeota archaeon]